MSSAVHQGGATAQRVPGAWQVLAWAWRRHPRGGVSRARLTWRALLAVLYHRKALQRWITLVHELHARGVVSDMPGEVLRAVRPPVHRATDFETRVSQLIDHVDWLETALQPAAFAQVNSGRPLVLINLPAPRGYEYLRVQLARAPLHSPEGQLLLTLTLQRSPDVQQMSPPVDVAVIGFSRFRLDNIGCLVVGGVRGQRNPVLRLSAVEMSQALKGWKAPVLMMRVMQELARYWGQQLIGLDPRWHQLQGWPYRLRERHRQSAARLCESYDALWSHFDARKGPPGWMILPVSSDEKLAAIALSPEKRARQIQRADYWIRISNQLRSEFGLSLQRPHRLPKLGRVTQAIEREDDDDDSGFHTQQPEDFVPSHVLETGPASLT